MSAEPLKLFISAGESSGDVLAAGLLEAMAKHQPVRAFGMGGARMRAAGFHTEHDLEEVSVNGLFEVLRHLPRLFRLKDALADYAIREKPDVAVLVDLPDFNIRLAKRLRAAKIPVVFYVGPTVWAWRPGRARRYGRYIDRLLLLFPFEVPVWQAHGVDAVCVGHPLADELRSVPTATTPAPPTFAVLPGSRASEIRRHLATLREAIVDLSRRFPGSRFVLPVADTVDRDALKSQFRDQRSGAIEFVEGEARRSAIASADVALVASGTATLEVALLGIPQIVFYRMNRLSYWILRALVTVKHIGLVNLIAGKEIARELIQSDFTAQNLLVETERLLADPKAARAAVQGVRQRLGPAGASDRAACEVLNVARGSK